MSSKDQCKTIVSKEISSITPCFDALSYLCEYLFELVELSKSIWFLFYQYTFYSCILSRVYSIRTSFIAPVAINKDWSHLFEKFGSC